MVLTQRRVRGLARLALRGGGDPPLAWTVHFALTTMRPGRRWRIQRQLLAHITRLHDRADAMTARDSRPPVCASHPEEFAERGSWT